MEPDTSGTLEIGYSIPRMLGLLAGSVILTAGAVAIALQYIPTDGDPVGLLVGYAGVLFFGFCTVVIFWRMLSQRGPVVSMTPQGIRDVRVAKELIPWASIRNLSRYEIFGKECLVVKVDPEMEQKLALTTLAKTTQGSNRALGADGLCVVPQGLSIDFATLFKAATAYAQRYGTLRPGG